MKPNGQRGAVERNGEGHDRGDRGDGGREIKRDDRRGEERIEEEGRGRGREGTRGHHGVEGEPGVGEGRMHNNRHIPHSQLRATEQVHEKQMKHNGIVAGEDLGAAAHLSNKGRSNAELQHTSVARHSKNPSSVERALPMSGNHQPHYNNERVLASGYDQKQPASHQSSDDQLRHKMQTLNIQDGGVVSTSGSDPSSAGVMLVRLQQQGQSNRSQMQMLQRYRQHRQQEQHRRMSTGGDVEYDRVTVRARGEQDRNVNRNCVTLGRNHSPASHSTRTEKSHQQLQKKQQEESKLIGGSESMPSLVDMPPQLPLLTNDDDRFHEHVCRLEQLDDLILEQQQLLQAMQQQQLVQQTGAAALDVDALENMYRQQNKITEDLQREMAIHQLPGTASVVLPTAAASAAAANGWVLLPSTLSPAVQRFSGRPRPGLYPGDLESKGISADGSQRRLNELNQRQVHESKTSSSTMTGNRRRLELNTEQWTHFLKTLTQLSDWLAKLNEEIRRQQSLGGDLISLDEQNKELQEIYRQVEEKRHVLERSLEMGRLFLQEDCIDSKCLNSENGDDSEGSQSDLTPEKLAQRIIEKIRRHLYLLPRKWLEIRQRSCELQFLLNDTVEKMSVFQATLDELSQHLVELEESARWNPVSGLGVENLQHEMDNSKSFHHWVVSAMAGVDRCNNMANQFQNNGIILSHRNVSRLEDLNKRCRELLVRNEERVCVIRDAIYEHGRDVDSSQMIFQGSLDHPWERAVTVNNVPYYINHRTEATQWDHPQMVNIMTAAGELNRVRFSAYRTSMKLRLLQKNLSFDQMWFERLKQLLGGRSEDALDATLSVMDVIRYLAAFYEHLKSPVPNTGPDGCAPRSHPNVNVPLAIDLTLNWLLNVYDITRSGRLKTLSFKVAILLLCNATLEDKYKFLFNLIVDERGMADQRRVGALLSQCIQIPKQLGEIASFGGDSVAPSIKSCFQKEQEIGEARFLEWMKLEPQSMVWLPVMHRMAAAETVKHQAKCNICKICPIIGFRYRCLKCFNFDLCQNCFFSGCKSKGHKLTHPMQEYSSATTSGEDVRDFTKTFKNKFRSKSYFMKHPRLGYLPVQSSANGTDTFKSTLSIKEHQRPPHPHLHRRQPSDPVHVHRSAEDMHSRLELCASRLAEAELKHMASTSDSGSEDEHGLIAQYSTNLYDTNPTFSLRSPMQIMMAVDARQRSELEAMIQDLEEENRILQGEYDRLKQAHSDTAISSDLLWNGGEGEGAEGVDGGSHRADSELIAEARLLRQHKGRLESRMHILEEHNMQLESQLNRLRRLLEEPEADTRIISFPPTDVAAMRYPASAAVSQNSLPLHGPPSFRAMSGATSAYTSRLPTDVTASDILQLRRPGGRNDTNHGRSGFDNPVKENLV